MMWVTQAVLTLMELAFFQYAGLVFSPPAFLSNLSETIKKAPPAATKAEGKAGL